MTSQQGIARREQIEHQTIAERQRTDHRILCDYARNNAERWATNFTSARLPDWLIQWWQLLAEPVDELRSVMAAATEERPLNC